MRSASAGLAGVALLAVAASGPAATNSLSLVHQRRYSMGTMFDVVVYHPSGPDAVRAVDSALAEIARLDRVMSHFDEESELSRVIRDGRGGFARIDPGLYEVIEKAVEFSRLSDGKFDVTIAPLVRAWKNAQDEGRPPSAHEIAAARECVGYQKIEMRPPGSVRFHSDCLEIDLGGIGKGYAVDRALAILRSAGIRRALINAGGSSIACTGTPPEREGWPVSLGVSAGEARVVLLRDASVSTSQQSSSSPGPSGVGFGGIVDPVDGAPAASRLAVSVLAPRATTSDALSTILVLLPVEQGMELLARFDGVSAVWLSPSGEIQSAYREAWLQPSGSR